MVFSIGKGGIFPVVPHGTRADEPFSICQSTRRRKAASSNAPSLKGVTRAESNRRTWTLFLIMPQPEGDCRSSIHPTRAVVIACPPDREPLPHMSTLSLGHPPHPPRSPARPRGAAAAAHCGAFAGHSGLHGGARPVSGRIGMGPRPRAIAQLRAGQHRHRDQPLAPVGGHRLGGLRCLCQLPAGLARPAR
jgi:hypothetical protein